MSFFGALVKTVVNVVKLPIELPVAVAKDVIDYALCEEGETSNTKKVIDELKEDAEG